MAKDDPTPYEKFEELTRHLLGVPKQEANDQRAAPGTKRKLPMARPARPVANHEARQLAGFVVR